MAQSLLAAARWRPRMASKTNTKDAAVKRLLMAAMVGSISSRSAVNMQPVHAQAARHHLLRAVEGLEPRDTEMTT